MNSWLFYFNFVGGIPISIQKDAARKDGWHEEYAATYEEKKNGYPKLRNKVIADCRKGRKDAIWVYSFVCFVPRRKYLRKVRAELAAKQAYIHEGATGWTTKGKRFADILEHSMDRWSKGGPSHDQAVKAGSKGGIASNKARRKRPDPRMPYDQAMDYWRDPIYRNADEAVAAINADDRYERPWSRGAAYRILKKRRMRTGPRGPRT